MLSKHEAIARARQEVESRGLPWAEPVGVTWGLFAYTVNTNADQIGGNVRVVVKRRTGKVVHVLGPTPR
jgi:hypothetical protein